eukprot:scaffold3716_cov69-Cylindrotheca_fusiformis.AAC.23
MPLTRQNWQVRIRIPVFVIQSPFLNLRLGSFFQEWGHHAGCRVNRTPKYSYSDFRICYFGGIFKQAKAGILEVVAHRIASRRSHKMFDRVFQRLVFFGKYVEKLVKRLVFGQRAWVMSNVPR